MKLLNFNVLITQLKTTCFRFPLVVLMVFIMALSRSLNIYQYHAYNVQVFVFSMLGALFMLTLYRVREKNNIAPKIFWASAALLLMWAGYSGYEEAYIRSHSFSSTFILTSMGILALGSFPILVFKDENKFHIYLGALLKALFASFAYIIILEILVMVALGTSDRLFDLNLDKTYSQANTWIFLFLWPMTFLGRIKIDELSTNSALYEKITKYLLVPAMTIYFLIIVVYLVKIVYLQSWPQGVLSYLIMFFILLGFMVLLFLIPLSKELWVIRFRKGFIYLLFPLSGVLLFSWYERFGEYGLTMARYYLVFMIIWIVITALYLWLSRGKHLANVAALLAFMAVFSIYGPISAVTISNASQGDRLLAYMQKYDLVQDGCFKENKTISSDDRFEITSILKYLYKHKGLVPFDKYLCSDTPFKTAWVYAFEMGFKLTDKHYETSFHLAQDKEKIDIKVKGTLLRIDAEFSSDEKEWKGLVISKDKITFKEKNNVSTFDLKKYFSKASTFKNLNNNNGKLLGSYPNSFLYFIYISGTIEDNATRIHNYSAYLFIPATMYEEDHGINETQIIRPNDAEEVITAEVK